jgi:hypothetical protein
MKRAANIYLFKLPPPYRRLRVVLTHIYLPDTEQFNQNHLNRPSEVLSRLKTSTMPTMTDMTAQLERGQRLVPIIHQQVNRPALQPISVILGKFNVLQNIVIRGLYCLKKFQAILDQSEERRKGMDKQGEGFIQLVNATETAYAAKNNRITSLEAFINSLDQEGSTNEHETMQNEEQSLQRYDLLRQHCETSKELNNICYEWENIEQRELEWRSGYTAAVDENLKCYEELRKLKEGLRKLQAEGLLLLERVQQLRKYTCGLDCIVEDYKHRYARKDEWRMGIARV